jgi:hypothetical protein
MTIDLDELLVQLLVAGLWAAAVGRAVWLALKKESTGKD